MKRSSRYASAGLMVLLSRREPGKRSEFSDKLLQRRTLRWLLWLGLFVPGGFKNVSFSKYENIQEFQNESQWSPSPRSPRVNLGHQRGWAKDMRSNLSFSVTHSFPDSPKETNSLSPNCKVAGPSMQWTFVPLSPLSFWSYWSSLNYLLSKGLYFVWFLRRFPYLSIEWSYCFIFKEWGRSQLD